MTPASVSFLLRLQQASTIHDAHELMADAVKAGATSDEVRQAITEWMSLQAAQVQQVVDLPPYDHDPVTTPDGLPVVGWSGPAVPTAPKCRCSHGESKHGADRKGRLVCFGSSVCGCIQFRRGEPAIPARFDERYDPSPEPIDRSIQ